MPTKETALEIDLPKPHRIQREILNSKARFRVVAAGRRLGKTITAQIESTLRLLKGQKIWFCSPTNENSKRVFREFEKMFHGWDESLVKINKTDMRIDFVRSGGFIEFKSLAEPDNLRGIGLNFLIVDEAAFVMDHVFDEILMPMLLSDGGDALLISSTNGRNWFWQKYNIGLSGEFSDWQSFHFTTYDNPYIKKEDLDALKKMTPSTIFEREYLAEFQQDGGAVFKNVNVCTRKFDDLDWEGEGELKFVKSKLEKVTSGELNTILGIDFGQLNDYTVITVFDIDTKEVIEYSRINQLTWSDIHSEIHRLNDRWKPYLIAAESNNSTANIEQLEREGLPIFGFRTTAKSKPEMINKLALAFENVLISIPNDNDMIMELSAYTVTKNPSGLLKYSAPTGLHDDIVMSLAVGYSKIEEVMPTVAYKVISF